MSGVLIVSASAAFANDYTGTGQSTGCQNGCWLDPQGTPLVPATQAR